MRQVAEKEGLYSYLTDFMNLADIFQYTINGMLITVSVFSIDWPDNSTRRVIASISCMVIWIKIFDFLRLFDATSFYIKLIM